MKEILLVSYDYLPYTRPASFRIDALLDQLSKNKEYKINIATSGQKQKTKNNFFYSYRFKDSSNLYYILNYIFFYYLLFVLSKKYEYDRVFVTSSKLFTAFFSCLFFSRRTPIYFDMRDTFVSNLIDKNKFFLVLYPFLFFIKKFTIRRARKVNLVSKGFLNSLQFIAHQSKKFDFYTNGIDSIFSNNLDLSKSTRYNKTIVYAGNIGWGQGLSRIIPELAFFLKQYKYQFIIYGEGSDKRNLVSKLSKYNLCNVIINNEISRTELFNLYSSASILFVHLNDKNSLKMTIPSKIFELLAFNKPILCGLFEENIKNLNFYSKNLYRFDPCNFQEALSKIKLIEKNSNLKIKNKIPLDFYREKISKNLAHSFMNM